MNALLVYPQQINLFFRLLPREFARRFPQNSFRVTKETGHDLSAFLIKYPSGDFNRISAFGSPNSNRLRWSHLASAYHLLFLL
jgi:hypothetical protein